MLPRMELRQLRWFVAVAEDGNISRAARRVFLTQSALSRQIKALEEELGQCLLERHAHSVRLTPAGEILAREARELLQQADAVAERVRTAGRNPRLRVGYAPSLAADLLPTAVRAFSGKHPNAAVELHDLSTQEMLSGLDTGTLDVALTVGSVRGPRGLTWTPLIRAAWRLAVPAAHPLARRARIGAAEVAGERLLVFSRREYPEYREIVLAWLRAHGQRPRLGGEYDGASSLFAAVASGLGVALVTLRSRRHLPGHVRLKMLESPPESLCIAAGFRADRVGEEGIAGFLAELALAARAPG
ncbi:MAG: LysR family transcriptional regulator [Verrucomicrobiae bacterium]|nr:LysR family transcriptional regulator [Verrucomicrobiae bacterium]